jgi:hypothetical protein
MPGGAACPTAAYTRGITSRRRGVAADPGRWWRQAVRAQAVKNGHRTRWQLRSRKVRLLSKTDIIFQEATTRVPETERWNEQRATVYNLLVNERLIQA